MTTLYSPFLIESAEQAEALPDGAILHRVRAASGLTGMVLRSPHTGQTYFRVGVDHWPVSRVVDTFAEALVPVEAKEETHSIQTRGQTAPEWRTRLVTPWDVLDDRP